MPCLLYNNFHSFILLPGAFDNKSPCRPHTTIFVRSTAFRCTNVYMHVRCRFATSLHRCRRRRRRRTTRSCLPRTPATDTHTLPLFVFIRRLFSLEMRESAADKKHPVYYRSPTPHLYQFGHITSRAPHPVRSAKLSGVEIGQYYGGGPHGKPGCRIFLFDTFPPTLFLLLHAHTHSYGRNRYFRVPFGASTFFSLSLSHTHANAL